MTLLIRRYHDADLETLLEVWEAAHRVGHPFFDEAELAARRRRLIEVHLPAAESWVAMEGRRIVGGIGLDGAFVGGLFVAPDRHGRGIGRALLAHAQRLKGVLTLEMYEANPIARAFYTRCGFAVVGRRETDDEGLPRPMLILRGPDAP